MRRKVFLCSLVWFVLCLPSIFYAQMSSLDKLKMQQQNDQFKNKIQANSQNVMSQSQEIVQKKQVEAVKYQEKQEEATEVFDKRSKKDQEPIDNIIKLYGVPVLMIMAIAVIFLIVWYKNI
ncbi:MAG: hypothetical protein NTW13_02680 [Candidatus Omnitrophica bacterium]|nr:hypothetical protein [Candidatus Omnitrophota bacterium]